MTPRFLTLACFLFPPLLYAQGHSAWPTEPKPQKHLLRHAVSVVTLSEPGRRQPCYALAIDATTLTCDSPDGSGHILFPRANVAAITEIYKPAWTPKIVATLAISVGLGVLLFVDPLLALPLGAVWLAVELTPDLVSGPPPPPRDPHRERVLYQRPGTPLSIDLDN